MRKVALVFENQANANQLVAGVPCAARALRTVMDSGFAGSGDTVWLISDQPLQLSRLCHQELERLCAGIVWKVASENDASLKNSMLAFQAEAILAATADIQPQTLGELAGAKGAGRRYSQADLRAAGGRIIAATGKPTDGFVSRYLNRPISQFLSKILLTMRFVRPIHATISAGILGVLMVLCLVSGRPEGLLLGAVLFQLASIIDGVDGEIARATFRTSKLGATLDTATDAATNFGFIGGAAFGLWQQGQSTYAAVGLAGLGVLIAGLTILGARSVLAGGPLTFDALKRDAHSSGSPIWTFLAQITSRDFYVLALALMVATGFAAEALTAFAIAAACWFIFVCANLYAGASSRSD